MSIGTLDKKFLAKSLQKVIVCGVIRERGFPLNFAVKLLALLRVPWEV